MRCVVILHFVAFVLSCLLLAEPATLRGCGIASRRGESVSIVDEDAIIVWDAAKKVQHFIRRASFRTLSPDFGFLVPTPTAPKLAEVDDGVFDLLNRAIQPKVREVSSGVQWTLACHSLTCGDTRKNAAQATKSAVRVLDRAKVGGFNAVVLEADDAIALEDWLKANGYPSTPELTGWLGPYLAQKWKITAFKIENDPKTGGAVATSKAVKMSFAAERPFFPYREPDVKNETANGGRRVLRVYFLSNQRTASSLNDRPWHAKTLWADRADDTVVANLSTTLDLLPEDFPATPWLTAFEDSASPRPANAEVFFEPSADQSVVHPPDRIEHLPPLVLPVELVVGGAMFLAFVVVKVLSKRASRAA